MLVDLAAKAWTSQMEAIRVRTGAEQRMFPDAFVEQIWKPAATRLGMKYLPDGMSGDAADIVAVALPPATTVFAARKLKSLPPNPDEAKEAARPAGQSPPTAPADAEAPAPTNVREFRRAVAQTPSPDLPKNAVF
jgi:hypothetical protein